MATIGSLVCTPRRGAVSIETMLCLREHLNGYPNRLLTAFRRPIVKLGEGAREPSAVELRREVLLPI